MSWAIKVENLGKKYRRGGVAMPSSNFRETVVHVARQAVTRLNPFRRVHPPTSGRRSPESVEFWALKGVNLEAQEGEILGVIGANGAGKSTLLKIMSRITTPTQGSVRYRGRVASLLEVGTGFHRELTGRENIFLNGAILGMRRAEIRKKLDDIVAFSGIKKFLDTPVKFYSSGMYVRLAFAVAAHLESDILLVDEVLAVGDAEFQGKCLGQMQTISRQGRTILFVSHKMSAIENLCSRCAMLDGGKIAFDGRPDACVDYYLNHLRLKQGKQSFEGAGRRGAGQIMLQELKVINRHGESTRELRTGESYTFEAHCRTASGRRINDLNVELTFYTLLKQRLFSLYSKSKNVSFDGISGDFLVRCQVPRFPLKEGVYQVGTWLEDKEGLQDWIEEAVVLDVVASDYFKVGRPSTDTEGLFEVDHEWLK